MTSADRSPPKLSVCLLAYNHAGIIEDSIRSVLRQDFTHYELILSDDCSRDGTLDVLQRLASEDARIRVIQTPRNLGMAGNANFAASHVTTPYIALLHHDDIYKPDLLRRWYEVAERHRDVGFVANGYGVYEDERVDMAPFGEYSDGRYVLERYLLPIWGSQFRGTALVRRSAWEAVGGMRERFGMLADVDLWMRLSEHWPVGYIAEPLIIVRQVRPEDYPNAYSKWSWTRMRTLYEIHGTVREEHYGREGPINRARWAHYRLRVSADITYWLAYAVAKRRWDMMTTSAEVSNPYELPPVKWLRRGLEIAAKTFAHPR